MGSRAASLVSPQTEQSAPVGDETAFRYSPVIMGYFTGSLEESTPRMTGSCGDCAWRVCLELLSSLSLTWTNLSML